MLLETNIFAYFTEFFLYLFTRLMIFSEYTDRMKFMKKTATQSHEKFAKALLIQHMLRSGMIADDVVLINELALENFSRRADIALVNGNIELFEIKSEADNLLRLSGQIETFTRYCDKMHVVAAPRHIEDILSSTPNEVAVWQLDGSGIIKIVRRGKKQTLRDKQSLLRLININELKHLLRENAVKVSIQRRKYLEAAAMELPVSMIRSGVLELLKERYKHTTQQFLAAISRNDSVNVEHLSELKRGGLKAKYSNLSAPVVGHEEDTHMSKMASDSEARPFGPPPEDIMKLLQSA